MVLNNGYWDVSMPFEIQPPPYAQFFTSGDPDALWPNENPGFPWSEESLGDLSIPLIFAPLPASV